MQFLFSVLPDLASSLLQVTINPENLKLDSFEEIPIPGGELQAHVGLVEEGGRADAHLEHSVMARLICEMRDPLEKVVGQTNDANLNLELVGELVGGLERRCG